MPFPAWCDTDLELFLALDDYESTLCTCGRPLSVCRDSANRWQVTADVCGPAAALARFHADHKDDLPDGLMVGVRPLAPGEEATDPIKQMLMDDLAAVRARHAPSGGNATGERAGQSGDDRQES